MLGIDLSGKRAFIAGVADDGGFGFWTRYTRPPTGTR